MTTKKVGKAKGVAAIAEPEEKEVVNLEDVALIKNTKPLYLNKPETKSFVAVFKKNAQGIIEHVKTCRAGAVNPYDEAAWYNKTRFGSGEVYFGMELEIPIEGLDENGWPYFKSGRDF